ncbi:MAG: hypothetical protein LQ342_008371 [Letrouitia transgressa]|nr:MAG: hypothetical protein LQ342_008371 [Letrouitia transgressa]
MADFDSFDDVFSFNLHYAYDEQTTNKIIKNRRSIEQQLFVDRLLKALGIDQASRVYPPRSNQNLRDLHQQICESASPDHHKQSLLYYILKDIPIDNPKIAETFANSCFLPEKYKIFIDGIWCLDRCRFERALDYLTEPVLTPTFPEEILYTFCTHPEQNDPTLPVAYYQTVSPALASYKVIEAYFTILCRLSITEAFFWSRQQGELRNRALLQNLIHSVLCDTEQSNRSARSVELINLPLNEDEEAFFNAYLAEGKGRNLPGAKDTLVMRGIIIGQSSIIADHGKDLTGRIIDGINWATVKDSIERSMVSTKT